MGGLGVAMSLLGALHAVLLSIYPPAVPDGSYSYPLPPATFAVSQGFLCLRDLALAGLLAALLTTPLVRATAARAGVVLSALCMLGLSVLEVMSVLVEDTVDIGAWYGFASFGVGLGLLVAGASAARTAGSGWLRLLPLTLGVYVFIVLTPGILMGFVAGQVVIGGWMLLFAALGQTLRTASRGSAGQPQVAQGATS